MHRHVTNRVNSSHKDHNTPPVGAARSLLHPAAVATSNRMETLKVRSPWFETPCSYCFIYVPSFNLSFIAITEENNSLS